MIKTAKQLLATTIAFGLAIVVGWYLLTGTKVGVDNGVEIEVTWYSGYPVEVNWAIDGYAKAEPRSTSGHFQIRRDKWNGIAAVHAIGIGQYLFRLTCHIRGASQEWSDGGGHHTDDCRIDIIAYHRIATR